MRTEAFNHVILLLIVLTGVSTAYVRVTAAYFCSYDDFLEVHRSAFEDSAEPSRVFTTPHFNSYKYRPLNRLANLLTYWAGQDNPVYFRLRNLVFHLLNVVLVYALGYLLFQSLSVAGLAAGLFGLHPMVNQSVIGAVMTNTMAHTAFLLAIVVLIVSCKQKRWLPWLIGGVTSGWLSFLAYDSNIIVFALMGTYLIECYYRRPERAVDWRVITVFSITSGVLLVSYFLLRAAFVPRGWVQVAEALPLPLTIANNFALYVVALLSPVDSVLANEWLNTPLPSEFNFNHSVNVVLGTLGLLMAAGLTAAVWRRIKRNPVVMRSINWHAIVLLVCCVGTPLLPVLFFQSHPSETYLYLSVAFYTVLLSYGLVKVILPLLLTPGARATCIVSTILITGLFYGATWVRNDRVIQCGETARRILYALPGESLSTGAWTIQFVNIGGTELTQPYGYYAFRGTDTIGNGPFAKLGISSALQLVYQNQLLSGEVIKWREFVSDCGKNSSSRQLCIPVHPDGQIGLPLDSRDSSSS